MLQLVSQSPASATFLLRGVILSLSSQCGKRTDKQTRWKLMSWLYFSAVSWAT